MCLYGQEMAPTGQTPLLKDSWHQNSILWEEQLADPTIAYIIYMVVGQYEILGSEECMSNCTVSRLFDMRINNTKPFKLN